MGLSQQAPKLKWGLILFWLYGLQIFFSEKQTPQYQAQKSREKVFHGFFLDYGGRELKSPSIAHKFQGDGLDKTAKLNALRQSYPSQIQIPTTHHCLRKPLGIWVSFTVLLTS